MSELLTGDFGADRIDYLMRDSHHLGVQYSRFDIHRLLNTLLVRWNEEKKGPELVVEDGGLHTVEAFVLARYFMFLDVYFHKTRRILDHHLVEFLKDHLNGGVYPNELSGYLAWDDHRVMQLICTAGDHDTAKRILQRRHFRVAFETNDHPELYELARFNWLKEKAEGRFGQDVVFDKASKDTYAFDQPEVFVFDRKWEHYRPLSECSRLVGSLMKIEKHRVYAAPEKRDDVTAFCNEHWKQTAVGEGRG